MPWSKRWHERRTAAPTVVPLPGQVREHAGAGPRNERPDRSIADLPARWRNCARISSALAEGSKRSRGGSVPKQGGANAHRATLVRASPPLALSPGAAARADAALHRNLQSAERAWIRTPAADARAPARQCPRKPLRSDPSLGDGGSGHAIRRDSSDGRVPDRTEESGSSRGRRGRARALAPGHAGRASFQGGGLWLVPSLIRMGLREWLAEAPPLCPRSRRVLLRTIAASSCRSG